MNYYLLVKPKRHYSWLRCSLTVWMKSINQYDWKIKKCSHSWLIAYLGPVIPGIVDLDMVRVTTCSWEDKNMGKNQGVRVRPIPISYFYPLRLPLAPCPLEQIYKGYLLKCTLQIGTPLQECDMSLIVSDSFHSRHNMFLPRPSDMTLCTSKWCYEHRHNIVKFFRVPGTSTTDTVQKLLLYQP